MVENDDDSDSAVWDLHKLCPIRESCVPLRYVRTHVHKLFVLRKLTASMYFWGIINIVYKFMSYV